MTEKVRSKEEVLKAGYVPAEAGEIVPWNEGDVLDGRLVEIRESAKFPGSFLMDVRLASGEVATRPCPTILHSKLRGVPIGADVWIRCLGMVETQSGQQAWDFEALYGFPKSRKGTPEPASTPF